jgi:peptidoglycan hydrolase-like protein with peptidoglycan-binding domain
MEGQFPVLRIKKPSHSRAAERTLQTALAAAGLYTGEIDGKFLALTEAAVCAFQKANGLPITGEVGPEMWKLL